MLRLRNGEFSDPIRCDSFRLALRGFGFPPFPTLAAENNARVFDRVVNCRRPWLHLGKGQ
jgi:hypothetical protein